jgi:hypothetical protein
LSAFPNAGAEEPNKPSEKAELFRFLMDGMKTNRMHLRQGVFRAHGRRVLEDPRLKRIEGPVEIYCAFDFPAQKLRFDRSEPKREVPRVIVQDPKKVKRGADLKDPNIVQVIEPKQDWRESAGKYIHTPNEMISLEKMFAYGEADPWRHAAVQSPDKRPPQWAKPFDVRVLGLDYWATFVSGFRGRNGERAFAFYDKVLVDEVSQVSDGVYRFRLHNAMEKNARLTLFIDAKHGVTVVRMEHQRRSKTPAEDGWDEPFDQCELTWKELSGVWVPQTLVASNRQGKGILEEYHLAFAWESVNQPVDDVVFTVKGLEPEPLTYVIDSRSGKPVTTDIIGFKEAAAKAREPVSSSWTPVRIVAAGFFTALLAALSFWIIVKRRRSRGI